VPVEFHRLATRDFVQARRHYARQDPSVEARFVAAVREAVLRAEANPYLGSPTHGSYYWVRTRRFPYVLYYEVIAPDLVRFYAVAHARRRPGYWLRRTRRP
jgi:plasmid stabilization system protein ParE